ncbi:MAG TPA: hypothetical protein VGV89_03775 [Thermoplasmata archaeon]|nr:hypothetical protein [Thermoplasmata archaeon]
MTAPSGRRGGRHSVLRVRASTLPWKLITIPVAFLVVLSTIGALVASNGMVDSNACGGGCNGTLQQTPQLHLGSVLGVPRTDRFWAVADQAAYPQSGPGLARMMSATPISTYRFDVGVDSTNQTTDTGYTDLGTTYPSGLDDAAFISWCRSIGCHAILGVPAETNNPGAAAATVRYVEQTLKFHPEYWSIGNEPGSWNHYGIPWAKWSLLDRSTCDATCYAKDVQRLVPALKKVDPSMRIIGIQDSYCGNDSYLRAVVAIDGPNLSAVACHMYPASQYLRPTLGQFYGALQGRWSLPFKMDRIDQVIDYECPGCNLPMLIDEYNAAWFPIPLMTGYPNAVFLAATIIQALSVNATQLAFFTLEDAGSFGSSYGMISPSGTALYPYYVYSTFAEHLALDEVVNATIRPTMGGVFSVETVNGTHRSLFVVNTNVTHALTFTTARSGFPTTGTAEVWEWGPTWKTPKAAATSIGPLPTTWTVPAQGIFLLDVS